MWWTKETGRLTGGLEEARIAWGARGSQSCAPPPSLPPPGLSQGTAGSWRHEAQGGGDSQGLRVKCPPASCGEGQHKTLAIQAA